MRTKLTPPRAAAVPSPQVVVAAKELGIAVREARQDLGLDQERLAFIANVSPRTVFAIEKGKATVRLDMVIRVLSALGLKLTTEGRDRVWHPETPVPR